MKLIYLAFLLLFCSMRSEYNPIKEKIFYQTIDGFVKKKQKCGFQPNGVGGGESKEEYNYGKHNFFCVMFHVNTKLTVEVARKLAVQTVKEFLSHINANKKIRNDLIEYPLTEKYVYIAISGQDININDSGYIKSVAAGRGEVSYRIGSRKPPTWGVVLEETFKEAERILQESS